MRTTQPEPFFLGRLETPVGTALVITDAGGVLRALDWEDYEPRMRKLLRLHTGDFHLEDAQIPDSIKHPLSAYFAGNLDRLNTIVWRVGGTAFQRNVWTALQAIPAGSTMTYGAFAAQLGMPRAVRAVGHANGANPISVVVPCHRLIGADGSLTGYGGGLERKRWLLQHEGVVLKPGSSRRRPVAV